MSAGGASRGAGFALVVCVALAAGCSRGPKPPFTDHHLDALGLSLTLPSAWSGGPIRGVGFVYARVAPQGSLSVAQGLVGVAMTEAGARAFLAEREGVDVEEAGPIVLGRWRGFAATGTVKARAGAWVAFAYFEGPRGPTWVMLSTQDVDAASARATWAALVGSFRPR